MKRPRVGVQPPAREAPRAVDEEEILGTLELVCGNAMMGDPPGPMLATRLQRECQAALAGLGLVGARVSATSSRSGTFVTVRLPRPDATVQQIRVRVK